MFLLKSNSNKIEITRLTTRKWRIIKVLLTQDSPRVWVTQVLSINCMTQLLLGLGLDLVLFASSTNVELGPWFAKVCYSVLKCFAIFYKWKVKNHENLHFKDKMTVRLRFVFRDYKFNSLQIFAAYSKTRLFNKSIGLVYYIRMDKANESWFKRDIVCENNFFWLIVFEKQLTLFISSDVSIYFFWKKKKKKKNFFGEAISEVTAIVKWQKEMNFWNLALLLKLLFLTWCNAWDTFCWLCHQDLFDLCIKPSPPISSIM